MQSLKLEFGLKVLAPGNSISVKRAEDCSFANPSPGERGKSAWKFNFLDLDTRILSKKMH
jgi:hypothetical protein